MAVVHVTADSFQTEVLDFKGTVLVDFWASWCGPCKMIGPIVEEISEEMPEIKVCKVDVDEEEELASRFNVMNIPTILIFKDGEVQTVSVGFKPKDALLELLT